VAFTEFYCDPVNGLNLNSGSTTAAAATYTATNGGWNSATGVFTPTSGNPSLTVSVGDFASVYTDGASAPTGFVARVTAVNSTTITLSTSAKAGTAPTTAGSGITIKVGGAWKGPNGASGFPFEFITNALVDASFNAWRVNFKNSATYNVTAALTHSLTGAPGRFQGYSASPGDGGRATIDGGVAGSSYALLTASGGALDFVDLIFNHNGSSGSANLFTGNGQSLRFFGCVFANGKGSNLVFTNSGALLVECEIYGAGAIGVTSGCFAAEYRRCTFHDNGTIGVSISASGLSHAAFKECVFDSNGTYGLYFAGGSCILTLQSCDFYNNGSDGLGSNDFGTGKVYDVENCNFLKNGRYGIGGEGGGQNLCGRISNCGFGTGTQANTSGNISGSLLANWDVVGSVNYASGVTPWTDPANGDFRISLAAAQGTGRGAFTQTAVSYSGSLSYPDIGSNQHADLTDAAIAAAVWAYENRTLTA
jgi:hypothetical protein